MYFKLESNLPLILTSYNRTLFTPVCGRDRFIYHNHKTQREVLAVTLIECAPNYINLYDHCLRTRRPAYITSKAHMPLTPVKGNKIKAPLY